MGVSLMVLQLTSMGETPVRLWQPNHSIYQSFARVSNHSDSIGFRVFGAQTITRPRCEKQGDFSHLRSC